MDRTHTTGSRSEGRTVIAKCSSRSVDRGLSESLLRKLEMEALARSYETVDRDKKPLPSGMCCSEAILS